MIQPTVGFIVGGVHKDGLRGARPGADLRRVPERLPERARCPVVDAHPRIRFQCARAANLPEDLACVDRWGHSRWRMYSLDLPARVLKKVYCRDALRYTPGLEVRS